MPQRDVLLRWIEQIAKVVARLLYGPGPIDLELAAEQIEAALAQHLGPLQALLPQMETSSAATLLHDPDRLFGYAQLLALQSAVQQAQGDARAAITRARSIAFAEAAIARDRAAPAEWSEWVARASDPSLERTEPPPP